MSDPLRTYNIESTYNGAKMGPRRWHAETWQEAVAQHIDSFPFEPITAVHEVIYLVTAESDWSGAELDEDPSVSVHLTEQAMLDSLRANYVAEGDEVADEDLPRFIRDRIGYLDVESCIIHTHQRNEP